MHMHGNVLTKLINTMTRIINNLYHSHSINIMSKNLPLDMILYECVLTDF